MAEEKQWRSDTVCSKICWGMKYV